MIKKTDTNHGVFKDTRTRGDDSVVWRDDVSLRGLQPHETVPTRVAIFSIRRARMFQ